MHTHADAYTSAAMRDIHWLLIDYLNRVIEQRCTRTRRGLPDGRSGYLPVSTHQIYNTHIRIHTRTRRRRSREFKGNDYIIYAYAANAREDNRSSGEFVIKLFINIIYSHMGVCGIVYCCIPTIIHHHRQRLCIMYAEQSVMRGSRAFNKYTLTRIYCGHSNAAHATRYAIWMAVYCWL